MVYVKVMITYEPKENRFVKLLPTIMQLLQNVCRTRSWWGTWPPPQCVSLPVRDKTVRGSGLCRRCWVDCRAAGEKTRSPFQPCKDRIYFLLWTSASCCFTTTCCVVKIVSFLSHAHATPSFCFLLQQTQFIIWILEFDNLFHMNHFLRVSANQLTHRPSHFKF